MKTHKVMEDEMQTVEEQIKEIIEERYGSIPKFAAKIEMSPQTIYSLLNRGIGRASMATVVPVLAELGIDSNWIARNRLVPFDGFETDTVDVPLMGRIAAGEPIEMDAVDNMFPIPRAVYNRYEGCFLLTVDGESMNRILPNGCYALINPVDTITKDNAPYAVCVNGYDATIKRVHRLNNGFELVPDSTDQTFRPVIFDYNEPGTDLITVIGEVVWYTLPYDWSF